MIFIFLIALFILAVGLLFAYQKIYNPGKLCKTCYRVVPNLASKCPFCDSDLVWDD